MVFFPYIYILVDRIFFSMKNQKRKVLGISKVDEVRRIYFPKSVIEELGLTIGDRIKYMPGKKVVIEAANSDDEYSEKIGIKQRVFVPKYIMEKIGLQIGSDVIFLREGNNEITLSKLYDRIKWKA